MTANTAPDLHAVSPVCLGDVVDVANLRRRLDSRHVYRRTHLDGGLQLFDYGRSAQYDNVWDHETLTCRGLIVTDDGTGVHEDLLVVARPFAKFFTVDQHNALAAAGVLPPLPAGEPFEVYGKEDGSLGVCYLAADGRPAVATRGSFHSPQAQWATEHLRTDTALEDAVGAQLVQGTVCVEIVSPVSRIVKDYGQFAGLILLAVLDRATGADLPLPARWPGPVVTRYDGLIDLAALSTLNWPNEEGFVVRFASGVRAKVKFAEYVRLHGLVTGCSTTMLWEHLAVAALRDAGVPAWSAVARLKVDHRFVETMYARAGDPLRDIRDRVPDEFDVWVCEQVTNLRAAHASRDAELRAVFAALPAVADRAEFAAAVAALPKRVRGAMFALADGASIDHIVWCDIRPEHTTSFATDPDA